MPEAAESSHVAREAAPVAPNARIATLDILRGVALLGMILAHFHKSMGVPANQGVLEHLAGTFVELAVAEKDRAMFAFVFGVGFAVMMARLESRGLPVVAIFLRRMAVLFLVGFAVDALTRFNILREYAWWGVPLLFLRAYPTRSLLVVALICASAFSIRAVVDAGYAIATRGYAVAVAEEREQFRVFTDARDRQMAAEAGSHYPDVIRARVRRVGQETFTLSRLTPTIYPALFILGLLAVRHGIFRDPRKHQRLLVGGMVAGGVCWVLAWWVFPVIPEDSLPPRVALAVKSGLGLVDEQFLAFTYIGALVLLLAYWPKLQLRLAVFAWAGRMTLTNYVLQAAVIEFAAAPYGLGLKMSRVAEVGCGLTLFAVLAMASHRWLEHFRFGPVEWAWRCLTYWQVQPLRVRR